MELNVVKFLLRWYFNIPGASKQLSFVVPILCSFNTTGMYCGNNTLKVVVFNVFCSEGHFPFQ
jgi:hypothetical protein